MSAMTVTAADTWVMAKRNLTIWTRVPAFIVFSLVQPVIFTLLFRYVFGGAIPVALRGGYVEYLLPGVIGQTAAFASMGTAISLASEVQLGVVDRLRAMPIARSAYLNGRILADVLRMALTVLVIVGVGYLVGFHFRNGFGGAVGAIALAIGLGTGICLVSAAIGLALKDEETVQAFGLVWLFPLTFVSSAFVPVQSMPGWLQAFANNQPITHVVNALRALALGLPLRDDLWLSVVWLAGITAVFAPLAVRTYQRVS
jgi:ABC-2 type transport system permease protein/oleandomycin transport system permease protein